jgi:hypothetical protein
MITVESLCFKICLREYNWHINYKYINKISIPHFSCLDYFMSSKKKSLTSSISKTAQHFLSPAPVILPQFHLTFYETDA